MMLRMTAELNAFAPSVDSLRGDDQSVDLKRHIKKQDEDPSKARGFNVYLLECVLADTLFAQS